MRPPVFARCAVLFVLAAGGPVYRPPAGPGRGRLEVVAPEPDGTLSDDELRSRVENAIGGIDVPVTAGDWRSLGARAIPLLEQVVANRDELPSRRAAALAGLAVIGGARARELVLSAARSEEEPFVVRAAALHGTSLLMDGPELVRQLRPVLENARTPAARAVAAEVLAGHAPIDACAAVRAQADRETVARAHFARALERCASAP